MSEKIFSSPDYIVSEAILSQKNEFIVEDIVKSVFETLKGMFGEKSSLAEFISTKIKALWEARILTFTGFAYYVNF